MALNHKPTMDMGMLLHWLPGNPGRRLFLGDGLVFKSGVGLLLTWTQALDIGNPLIKGLKKAFYRQPLSPGSMR